MNRRHSAVTEWGLSHVSIQKHDTILDVGCGGGATITRLAALASDGKVYGADYSEVSVAESRRTNHGLIASGRAEIVHASVSALPFPDGMFDLVTAVETHYYWPDLVNDLRETLRVLKARSALVLIAEAYKGGKYDRQLRRLAELQRLGIMSYAHLTVSEHSVLLSTAGFSDVRVLERHERGWLCAMGRKQVAI
jgi:ubiquinone/menaquinone biosynthesis C-methylase UbiE